MLSDTFFCALLEIFSSGTFSPDTLLLKSDNLQYNTLGRWDERLIDQTSDVPTIFFSELKDRICILFFCHSHSTLSNVYPVDLESTRG